jgi:hypothetical protein
VIVAVMALSGFATLAVMGIVMAFDHQPGAVTAAPPDWPSSSTIKRVHDRRELLVFVHPFCSCTVATMNELARLSVLQRPARAELAIDVLFYRPRGSKWKPGSLWQAAQLLPGAHARWDDDAREARKFGALTSGYALLYSAGGKLLFNGGVTGSRGHEGDNSGLDELQTALNSGKRARKASFVFGCALGGISE